MVALRSRRLETLFGAPLDVLTAAHIHGLVTSTAQEAFDLDFKLTHYGRSDSDRRALAGDVAALANTAGGVIVIGIDEDRQACATDAPGVDLSDAEFARIRQVVASLVAPMPVFDIVTVPNIAPLTPQTISTGTQPSPNHGFVLIAVPRSLNAPHAVLINEALRYPKRNGATTRYLSEPEVATAYRDRLAGAQRQAARIQEIEREAIDRLDAGETPWAVVSLVPDLTGDMDLSYRAYRTFQHEILKQPATILSNTLSISRARIGQRRLLADGTMTNSPLAKWVSLEFHTDGSGVYALGMFDHASRRNASEGIKDDAGRQQLIDDEGIVVAVVSGLMMLAKHARDRAAAGGNALVRAQLFPISSSRPTQIGRTRHGSPESRSTNELTALPTPAEIAVDLDSLAEPGPSLIAAGALLVDQLGQAYGIPEMGQLTRDGQIRRPYWTHPTQHMVAAWCEAHGVEVVDEQLA